nr:MFS transporter [Nocardioides sp. zg-DK7169]
MTGWFYVVVAFLGRLPMSMSQIGTLLLVATSTGSYGTGGAAAGGLAVANAIGSPLAGGLADRIGQRPVVLVQSVLGAAGLGALVALTDAGAADGVLIASAALAGFFMPQVGPLARVRWRPITQEAGSGQGRLMSAAFSYEGAADEAAFVLGPALVGGLVALASPGGALVSASVLLLVFGSAFAIHPTARLTGRAVQGAAEVGGRLFTPLLGGLLLAQLFVGMLFGSVQTGTTALADQAGHPEVAGLVHALLGVGSVLAGLATVALPERFGLERRVLAFAAALVVLSTPLLGVDSIGALIAVVLLLGFAVAPYMISVFTLGERLVPMSRVGMAMTLLGGATGVGYALGSGAAGRAADAEGYGAAFVVTVAATVGAVLLALLGQRPVRRALDAASRASDATAEAAVSSAAAASVVAQPGMGGPADGGTDTPYDDLDGEPGERTGQPV